MSDTAGAIIFIVFILLPMLAIAWVVYDGYKKKRQRLKNGDIMLQYLGGHPGILRPLKGWLSNSGNYINFWSINIAKSGIMDLKLVPKSGSGAALAGATVGMLVAGPVGALAGGAAASNKPGTNYLLQMSYMESGIRYEIFFDAPDILNKYPQVQRLIHNAQTKEASVCE